MLRGSALADRQRQARANIKYGPTRSPQPEEKTASAAVAETPASSAHGVMFGEFENPFAEDGAPAATVVNPQSARLKSSHPSERESGDALFAKRGRTETHKHVSSLLMEEAPTPMLSIQTDAAADGGWNAYPATSGLSVGAPPQAGSFSTGYPGSTSTGSNADHTTGSGGMSMQGIGDPTTGAPEGASEEGMHNQVVSHGMHVLEPTTKLSAVWDQAVNRAFQQMLDNWFWVLHTRDADMENHMGERMLSWIGMNTLLKSPQYANLSLDELLPMINVVGILRALDKVPGQTVHVSNMATVHIQGPSVCPNLWMQDGRDMSHLYAVLQRKRLAEGKNGLVCWQLVPWCTVDPTKAVTSVTFSEGEEGHLYFLGTFHHSKDPDLGEFNRGGLTPEGTFKLLSPDVVALGANIEVASAVVSYINKMPQIAVFVGIGLMWALGMAPDAAYDATLLEQLDTRDSNTAHALSQRPHLLAGRRGPTLEQYHSDTTVFPVGPHLEA